MNEIGSIVSPEWLLSTDDEADDGLDKLISELPATFFSEMQPPGQHEGQPSALSQVESKVEPRPHTSSEFREHGNFGTASMAELQRLLNKNVNSNTKRSTNTWANRLLKWKAERGIKAELMQLDQQRLDEILQQFYAEVRKEDGTDYEPDSLRTMLAALDRYFKANDADFSLLKDKAFERSRLVLNGKAIELRESGRRKRKKPTR